MSNKDFGGFFSRFFGAKRSSFAETVQRIDKFFLKLEKSKEQLDKARGIDPNLPRGDKAIVCPFCQTRGTVRTKKKSQTSVGKGIGAALTFGVSTIFTGLNKHQSLIQATCAQCKQTWDVGKKTW